MSLGTFKVNGARWKVKKAGFSIRNDELMLLIKTFPCVDADKDHLHYDYDALLYADGCLNVAFFDKFGGITIDYSPDREGMDSFMDIEINGALEIDDAKGKIAQDKNGYYLELSGISEDLKADIGDPHFEYKCRLEQVENWSEWQNRREP